MVLVPTAGLLQDHASAYYPAFIGVFEQQEFWPASHAGLNHTTDLIIKYYAQHLASVYMCFMHHVART